MIQELIALWMTDCIRHRKVKNFPLQALLQQSVGWVSEYEGRVYAKPIVLMATWLRSSFPEFGQFLWLLHSNGEEPSKVGGGLDQPNLCLLSHCGRLFCRRTHCARPDLE